MIYLPVVVATVGGEAEAELGGLGGEGLCEAMTFCQLLYVLKLVVLLSRDDCRRFTKELRPHQRPITRHYNSKLSSH